MRKIFQIGHNDLRLFLKEKSGYLWLFVVPIGFVYFTGAAMRGGDGEPSNPRPSALIENLDQGELGKRLVDALDTKGLRLVDASKRDEASRGIRIPEDFTEKVQREEAVKIQFFTVEGSSAESAAMIKVRLFRALIDLNARMLELATETESDIAVTAEGLDRLLESADVVPLEVSFAGKNPVPVGFNQSLPGNLVMFLMMNLLIFGGSSISSERQIGVIRRFAVHPIRRWELVTGKIYGRFLLGCVIIGFFLLVGPVLFGVNVGDQTLAIAITLMVYAWVAASLGVLIGATTANPDKTVGLCVLASMVMAALGGCWWPMEVVPDTMKTIGHMFPTAWAMDALHQLISFGGSWSAVIEPLGVLVLFAVVANFGAGKLLKLQ